MRTEAIDGSLAFNIEVPRRMLSDLICSAVEGGSNNWAVFKATKRTADLDYIEVKVTELEVSRDGQPRANRYIGLQDMAIGLQRLAEAALAYARATGEDTDDWLAKRHKNFQTAGKHLGDALAERGDATTADVVLQMAVFGEVIYG